MAADRSPGGLPGVRDERRLLVGVVRGELRRGARRGRSRVPGVEHRVADRTAELERANKVLQAEIIERELVEA